MDYNNDSGFRRGWCCNNEGAFLFLQVEVLTAELAKPVVTAREVCFLSLLVSYFFDTFGCFIVFRYTGGHMISELTLFNRLSSQ